MAQTIDTIRTRVSSLLATTPFAYTPSNDPFDFGRDPIGVIDGAFGIQVESGPVTSGTNYSECRIDTLRIDVARLQNGDPQTCYDTLLTDCRSIIAAVTRDGLLGGDYNIPDEGRAFTLFHEPGRAFSVLRVSLPVDYDAQV